jgi:hypothetical protein
LRGFLFRYVERGTPVIHLLNIKRLAIRNALPVDPIPLPEPRSMREEEERRAQRRLCGSLFLSLWCGAALIGTRMETRRDSS